MWSASDSPKVIQATRSTSSNRKTKGLVASHQLELRIQEHTDILE